MGRVAILQVGEHGGDDHLWQGHLLLYEDLEEAGVGVAAEGVSVGDESHVRPLQAVGHGLQGARQGVVP